MIDLLRGRGPVRPRDLDDDEEEEEGPPSVVGRNGVRVHREMCSTCIFRPGNLMHLDSGRLKDMVERTKALDTYVVCHQTLDGEEGVACKGSWDTIYTTAVQLAERLDFIEWVEPTADKETT